MMTAWRLILHRHPRACCLAAGACVPLSFAPFNVWPIAILALALWASIFSHPGRSARQQWVYSLAFGFGLFASGASWVYVSIHDYGYASVPLSLLLTLAFVSGLALVFSLPFLAYSTISGQSKYALPMALPALWLLGEWLRSWFLTGFPWLFLGNAHIGNSPLSGWIPIVGVYGVSSMVVFTAIGMVSWVRGQRTPLLLAAALFGGGAVLQHVHWTRPIQEQPVHVAIVQPNFALSEKWDPARRLWIRDTLSSLSEPLWGHDLIVWPEAALSEWYHEALPFLQEMDRRGKESNTTLVTGIPYAEATATEPLYYNSVIALGTGQGLYHKTRLVPFGEYVPLENLLRGVIRFFDLPMSRFSKGGETQHLLQAGAFRIAPFICYEIVYPDLVARNARASDFLVTISNDSWFGRSLGPSQHLQMAQARALETGRYVVRATNDGISALIDTHGHLLTRSNRFEQQTLTGVLYPVQGNTPYTRWGSLPVRLLAVFLLCALWWRNRRR